MKSASLVLSAAFLLGAPSGAFAAFRCEAVFESAADSTEAALDQLARFYAQIQTMTDAKMRAMALEDFREKYIELEKQVGSSIRERVTGQSAKIETGIRREQEAKAEIVRADRDKMMHFKEVLNLTDMKVSHLRNSSLYENALEAPTFIHKRAFNRGGEGVEWGADERFVHIHGVDQRTEVLLDLTKRNIMRPKFEEGSLSTDGRLFARKDGQKITIEDVKTGDRWQMLSDHGLAPNAEFLNSKFIILQKYAAVVSRFENFKIWDYRNHQERDLGVKFGLSADGQFVASQKDGRIEIFDLNAWKVVKTLKGEFSFFDITAYSEGFFVYKPKRLFGFGEGEPHLFDFRSMTSKKIPDHIGEIVEVSKDGRFWVGHRLNNRSITGIRADFLYDSLLDETMTSINGLRPVLSPSGKYALLREQSSNVHGVKTVLVDLARWTRTEIEGNFSRFDQTEENISGPQLFTHTHKEVYGLVYNLQSGKTTALGGFVAMVPNSPYIVKYDHTGSLFLQLIAENTGEGDNGGTFLGVKSVSVSPSGKYILTFNEDAQGERTIVRVLEVTQ